MAGPRVRDSNKSESERFPFVQVARFYQKGSPQTGGFEGYAEIF